MSDDVILSLGPYKPGHVVVSCSDAVDAQELKDLAKAHDIYQGVLIAESAAEYVPPIIMAVAGSGGFAAVLHAYVFRNQHKSIRITLPDGREVEVHGYSEDETPRIIKGAVEALEADDAEGSVNHSSQVPLEPPRDVRRLH